MTYPKFAKTRSYPLALLLLLAAIPISRALDAPSSCFILVVMASSLYGGRGPALFATLLSSLAFEIFFVPAGVQVFHARATLLRFGILLGAMLLTIEIIEARKRSERGRLQLVAEFQSLAETSPDCILSIEKDGTISFANLALTRMFGYGVEEVLGQIISWLIPGLHPAGAGGEFSVLRKDGSSFEVEANCGGFAEKQTVFLRDISERRRTQRKLMESEESLRLTLETIPGQVYTRLPDGTIDYANGGVTAYLGKSAGANSLAALSDSIHPDEKDAVLRQAEQSFAAGVPYTMEYRSRRYDGAYRWLQASTRPLRSQTGAIIRWYALLTDIDDLRRAEESLLRTQTKLAKASQAAAISELSASLAHEISQPISAMVANGQACLRWLAASPPCWEDARGAAERIVRDGKDAGQVIRGLRSLYQHVKPATAPLRLAQIMREVLSLLRGRAEREGVTLEMQVPADLRLVLGDRLQLQQVLVNLATNGLDSMQKATGRTKRLILRSCLAGPHVLTEVEDCGGGVLDLNTIFDPFTTTKEQGLGMGLSICRSIIEAHGGKIWASSDPAGGATFSFTVPVAEEGQLAS